MRHTKEDFYWSIPSIENSYYAGLIAADGNISSKHYRLSINLAESDKALLIRLKNALKYTGDLFYIKPRSYVYKEGNRKGYPAGYTIYSKGAYSLQIHRSKQYFEDLEKWYNITANKSLTLKPPNITDPNIIKAYIIGYFDGDGSLFYNKKNKCYQLSILGTDSLLRWMRQILEDSTLEHFYFRKRPNGLYEIQKGGSGVYKFLEVLSGVDVPKLERKWIFN